MTDKNKPSKTPMTPSDAARIQGHADRTNTNQDFKARAQAAGWRNSQEEEDEDDDD